MTGRNDPCPCGSGKKYKKCCWPKDRAARVQALETKETPELPETDAPWEYHEPESILKPAGGEDSRPAPEDATLQQHLAEYEMTIVPEKTANLLDYYTGRKTPAWNVADFVMTNGKTKDPTQDNYTYLMAAFTHYAHHEEGFSLTTSEMVGEQLSRYFMRRHSGELDEVEDEYGRRPQRRRQRKRKKTALSTPFVPMPGRWTDLWPS